VRACALASVDVLDLHSHTTASDGALRPAELIRAARAAGVTTLAVTDHDTLEGLREAVDEGDRVGVEVLTGVEISTTASTGAAVHVLGYLFRAEDPELRATLTRVLRGRADRNEAMAARLAELGMPVALEEVRALADGTVGRPHFARAMVIAGYVSSVDVAFSRWLGDGKPACVDRAALTPAEAVRAIQRAGGVAVLAHPLSHRRSPEHALRELEAARDAGFDGVEVYYRNHTPGEVRMLRSFAAQLGLIGTGGSDMHDGRWPTPPALPPNTLDLLQARARTRAQAA
jgi:predicted metal-dependent phosphoesterase TrpH